MKRTSRFLAITLGCALVVSTLGAGLASAAEPTSYFSNIESVSVTLSQPSEAEKSDLQFMFEEEKLARDVYLKLSEIWNVRTFANISNSEQNHMNAVKGLLDAFGLPAPALVVGEFANPEFSRLYTQLVEQGSRSLADAYAVGAYIEEIDLKDLKDRLGRIVQPDIERVFNSLANGSRNHLRTFVSRLSAQGVPYAPRVLGQAEFDSITGASYLQPGNTAPRGAGRMAAPMWRGQR